MKVVKIGLALAIASVLASAPVLADKGKGKEHGKSHSKSARSFDVCVDGVTGAKGSGQIKLANSIYV